jgi:sugar lactone lactonase YvrE
MTTVAGNGHSNPSGDGGLAIHACLTVPNSVAVDAAGNLYIVEYIRARVRKVDTEGRISTFAGIEDKKGSSGDGGPATKALLNGPAAVAVDSVGNVLISDFGNKRLRLVDTAGEIQTILGSGTSDDPPIEIVDVVVTVPDICSTTGGIYIVTSGGQVLRVDENFKTTPLRTDGLIAEPTAMTADSAGYLYVASYKGRLVTQISQDPNSEAVPPPVVGGLAANGVAVDSDGNFFVSDADANLLFKVEGGVPVAVAGDGFSWWNGDGKPATKYGLAEPAGIALHPDGSVYFADMANYRVRKLEAVSVPAPTAADFTVKQPDWPAKVDLARGSTTYSGVRVDYVPAGTVPVPPQTIVVTLPPGRGLAFVPQHGSKCMVTVQEMYPPAKLQSYDGELSGDSQTLTIHNVDLLLSSANLESGVWVAITAEANAPSGTSRLTYNVGGKQSGSTPIDVK